ncbi:hypothetical protein M378DRAFT_80078, partial [Amanita muscaria Koide BX008]
MTSNASASTSDQIPPLPSLKPPSTFFTGRDTYLRALQDHFSPETDCERKRFLLYGMGGIGKTQICLKFIEQYGKIWFPDIFWIDASSEHTIDLCLRQIAQKYKVDSTPSAESALEWISGRKNWLMVFDNADGGYHVVEKSIPPGSEGNILITSRDKGLARIASGTHPLEVTEMGEEDAIIMLLKSAMVYDNSVDVAITAQKLVAALGYIPLAIDQAGAYVQSCGCELAYYLELFIKHRVKLMSDKEFHGASLYNHSTYEAWDISIEEIKRRAGGQNSVQSLAAQSALTLHNLFAFLHQDNISREIFKNAALNFMKRKGRETNGLPQTISLLDSRTLLLDADGNWDALQFQAGIKVLLSFSLIRSNGMLYSVHPLIQTWSRDRISLVNVSDCCKKSRALLACSLDFRNQEDDYRFCSLLAPHIRTNGGHAAQLVSDEQYFDDQNRIFALVFFMVGDWDQAEKLWRETSHARETRLGEKHPDTLTTMSNLALTYSNQGKQKEAESLQVKYFDDQNYQFAFVFDIVGDWNQAEKLQRETLDARETRLGANHPDTLNAMGNLAATYRYQGKWKEAESLEVKVMEAR